MTGLRIVIAWLFGGGAIAWLCEGGFELIDAKPFERPLILGLAVTVATITWLVGQIILLLASAIGKLNRRSGN